MEVDGRSSGVQLLTSFPADIEAFPLQHCLPVAHIFIDNNSKEHILGSANF